jgi:hypothetical protein
MCRLCRRLCLCLCLGLGRFLAWFCRLLTLALSFCRRTNFNLNFVISCFTLLLIILARFRGGVVVVVVVDVDCGKVEGLAIIIAGVLDVPSSLFAAVSLRSLLVRALLV